MVEWKWKTRMRLYFSSKLIIYELKNTVFYCWGSFSQAARGQLRPGRLAEPEEQRLLFNFQFAISAEEMDVHLYFTFFSRPR